MKYKWIGIGLVTMTIVVVLGYMYFERQADVVTTAEYWSERITSVGARDAHTEFVEAFEPLSAYEAHAYAHTFGTVLYSHEGTDGVTICDNHFLYGCFHEVIIASIVEHGLGAIDALYAACSDIGCEHGIGHALQTYLGYTFENLHEALVLCDTYLPTSHAITGCYGGVFMEYNLRMMLAEDTAFREFKGDWYDPCDTLTDEAAYTSCIFRLPRWWMRTELRHEPVEDAIRVMGEKCRALEGDAIAACFGGIANAFAVVVNFDGQRVHEFCTHAAHTPEELSACQLPTLVAMYVVPDMTPAEIVDVCRSVPESDVRITACIEMLDEKKNKNYIDQISFRIEGYH